MTKQELLRALEPFDDETLIHVEVKVVDGSLELAIFDAHYKPALHEQDAYITLRTFSP